MLKFYRNLNWSLFTLTHFNSTELNTINSKNFISTSQYF
ncbi:hypothetical protein MED217_06212 [Leeuwenhoekiella blandensis MED217]|uniref:Uncharacterized protein n=1 Tax=Leeuwenhoekiella blandensis (strain CECT 7118 / CCUG 51940 / KCTC 22103 / MED217) TaxID=398720 RepID=A3XIL5_LEEBM|nr:hypothetical protein MED217_06212 [Leeuwenhoekiella blandensis MED217]